MLNYPELMLQGKAERSGKYDKQGFPQDEVFSLGPVSFWLYHGNPIAAFNRDTHELRRSACGWKSPTTKKRLNQFAYAEGFKAPYIYQRNYTWYIGDDKPFEDASFPELPALYHKIDGWRGYSIPTLALYGASDCGTWSDSPAPSSSVLAELESMRSTLRSLGFKTRLAWTESSNAFMIKRWILIQGKDIERAIEESKTIDISGDTYIHLAH